jgi:hypothetical protein
LQAGKLEGLNAGIAAQHKGFSFSFPAIKLPGYSAVAFPHPGYFLPISGWCTGYFIPTFKYETPFNFVNGQASK